MPSPAGAPRSVLVLATTFPATAGDGTPEFVLTLSSSLARRGVAVSVLVPRTPGSARDEVIDGVRVHRFSYLPRRWERLADGAIMANLRAHPWQALQVAPLMISFGFAALRHARRERPQIVHAHWLIPSGLVAWLVRSATHMPYVVTVHGGDAYTLRGPFGRSLKRLVMRGAAAVVPVSRDIESIVGELGPVSPPVPMGVDVPRVRAEVGVRRPEPGRILFVGRLVEKKGVDVLLQALAELPRASVVVAGGGPLQPGLEDLARGLGVAERVDFLGGVPRKEVMRQFSRASVVVLPSQVGAGGDQDGVPVVLAEAVAAGVPVVASRLGGLAEHLTDGETAWLAEPGSAPSLTSALRRVLDDPERAAAVVDAASEIVLPRLSIEHTADAYVRHLSLWARG